MARANERVEELLNEYRDLLAVTSSDPHKPRAYEKAARSIGGYHADVAGWDVKQLQQVPSVGKSIAEKVAEILEAGTFRELEELRQQIPPGVRELMTIPGLGPKRAITLYRERRIASIQELLDAIEDGSLAGLAGFGEKTEENIKKAVSRMQRSEGRVLMSIALDVAEELLEELRGLPQVQRCDYAGSLRRMRETIGDIDLLVASDDPVPVMDAFASSPRAERVLAKGETKTSILTTKGLQVDLRVVPPGVWGAALQYFTGSKAHNVRIREMAVRKKLKLSEYGLFHAESGELIVAETEEEVYERLGMPWIHPTLREDRGEVEAALKGELPVLLQLSDLRGDLHTHTNLTDGLAPLDEMVGNAAGFGYAYYAVTDHAPNLYMQRMTDQKMLAQREQLRALQSSYPDMVLLHGTELNIDAEGEVDWPPEFLEGFDITVASIHSYFDQTPEQLTARLIRAMENPYVNIIGHPTTRLIGRREGIEFDFEAVFEAAARTGTALEVNAEPDRLDLRDEHIQWARRHGVVFSVDTDSHSPVHLAFMRFGVGTAQRGWLTSPEVLNTWPLEEVREFVAAKRRRA